MPGLVRLLVNGISREVYGDPAWRLLTVLRDHLHLTGTKYGCGEGECGACTVLVDGNAVKSCVTPLADVGGQSITTIEGLGRPGALHPVQQAFNDVAAMQCGFCTPGMILSTVALLTANPSPNQTAIRNGLDGNICRCCTYPRIERAVKHAAELIRSMQAVTSPAQPLRAYSESDETMAERTFTLHLTVPWDLLRAGERDYHGVLGNGLTIVMPPGVTPRERPAETGRFLSNGGAWLHVGEDGIVTAFSGKVDVGQDNRTALAMLVAEELRIPVESVRVVLGDTDTSPYDIGTFGSRSMPDPGEYLRGAAATARDVLLGMAADRLGKTREELVASGGTISDRQGGDIISYADLVQNLRQVEESTVDAPVTPRTAWQVAGQTTPRVHGERAVTGEKHFPSDLARPGMLHGAVLRPPAQGATPLEVDITRAAELPEVTVVHEGTFIGAVAADPFTARRALRTVKVEWQNVPQVDELLIVEFLRTHPVAAQGPTGSLDHRTGDIDAAFLVAGVTVEATYTTAYIAHVPLETRVAVAEWDSGRVTVWTGTQTPYRVRSEVAVGLGISESQVQVIVPPTGGAFGGKHSGEVATEAARLSRASGRPVRVMWSREEEFQWGYLRPAAVIDVRSGASEDGRISAWDMAGYNNGPAGLTGPYDIPNQRIRYQPTEWPLRQGSYRGVAATASHFARESHIDEIAHATSVDPLDLRLHHIRDDRLANVLRTVADRSGWRVRSSEPGRGLGIAGGIEKGGYIATVADVTVDLAGALTVNRLIVAYDCGAVVNPDNVLNQVEGGTVMGLGGALREAIHFANGNVLNPRLSQYHVPRLRDVPPVDVVLINRPELPSYGAGETPIITVAPALANAIFAATGRRIRHMPLAPDGTV